MKIALLGDIALIGKYDSTKNKDVKKSIVITSYSIHYTKLYEKVNS